MRKVFIHIWSNLRWYILFFLISFSLVIWYIAFHEDRGNIMKVVFLDVGQGNATFIESPTGNQVIIDGGPNKSLMKEISSVLPWYDRHIDMLIVTHPDKDHYEGFIPLLSRYSTDVFMESGIKDISTEYQSLKQKIIDKKIPSFLARRGEVIDMGGGAYIEILFPDRDVSGLESNNGSIICRLVYGDTSLLIEGDAPQAMESYVLTLEGENIKNDMIELGHHGAKTSSGEEYLKSVAPQYAIISAGKDNSYGHPNKETIDTLNKLKIPYLITFNEGRITFLSDGKEFVKK